jgi:transposase
MASNGKEERDAQIYARRIEGFSFQAIANEFGLTRETVRQIARRMERKAKWRERGVRHGGVH